MLDRDVLAFLIAELSQSSEECAPEKSAIRFSDRDVSKNPYPKEPPRLLGFATERRDEHGSKASYENSAIHYSITVSARSSSEGGMVRSRAFHPDPSPRGAR
jgi:hypothetical protein